MTPLRPETSVGRPLVTLRALLALPPAASDAGVLVRGVTLDSHDVRPGDLFAALPGSHVHGRSFATDAVARGAVAVLTDGPVDVDVATLVLDDPREALGPLASWIYGEPSKALTVLGVTGTNGKTTTSYLIDGGLKNAGHRTGLLGTVETRLVDQVLPASRTTPEAPDLQALLAVLVERGADAAAMEVSSHSLALHRVDGTSFAAAVFTNLSQEHLDFHHDITSYFNAKARLFRPEFAATAVLNADDPYGVRLMEQVRIPHVTYSVAGVSWADWRGVDVHGDARGSAMRALGPAGEDVQLRVALPGGFNAANALAALATLVSVGVDVGAASDGIAGVTGVPGRLERVDAGQPFVALVDYAHTPAAVAGLLAALRDITSGRLVVVLGCGGDRDRGKRPQMGRAAVEGADLAVFTSDNPRSEDPRAILADMTEGLSGGYVVEPDRAAAIALALEGLGPGDTLVIAGKGHETGQEVDGVVRPFDDREVLREALVANGATA